MSGVSGDGHSYRPLAVLEGRRDSKITGGKIQELQSLDSLALSYGWMRTHYLSIRSEGV